MESEETKVCVKWDEGPNDDDILNQVGRNWPTEKRTGNPLYALIDLETGIINRKKYLLSFISVVAQN